MQGAYPVPQGRRKWYDRYDAISRNKPDEVFDFVVGDNAGGPRTESVELVSRSFATTSMGAVIFKLHPNWEEDRSWRDEDARSEDTGIFDPGAGGGEAGAGLDDSYPGDFYASELCTMLQDLVDRDSWRDAGGEVGSIRHVGGVLLIKQTRANHKAIIKVLNGLRDAWRKRRPQERSATDIAGDLMSGWEKPETPFTASGRIAKWIGDLLNRAKTGRLSEFSSVRVEKVGSRAFARIYGIWLDTSLTEQCEILPVARGSAAHTELLNTAPALKECLSLGRYVIVRIDNTSAVYLNRGGISKTDDKQFKKMIESLAKRRSKR